jgi:hypothetical protein
MTFDAKRGRAVLFGGGTCGPSGCVDLGDTGEWDGVQWGRACTDSGCSGGAPAARLAHAAAFDRARSRTVIFGGTSGALDEPLSETWEWDGSKWTRACAASPCADAVPPARFAHALAYDVTRKVTVLFGGQGKGVRLGDTWEYDGTRWTAKCVDAPCNQAMPSARSRHTMAYDEKRGKTVLFGGIDGPIEGDTWEWDGTHWEQLQPPVSPPPRAYGVLAYDALRSAILLFGGEGGASSLADAWTWDGTVWRQEIDTESPSGRTAHAMVYDQTRGHLLVFGGFGQSVLLGDTWEHRRIGGACKVDGDCEGGHCVDGLCCESTCSACERCDVPSPGECAPVLSAEDEGSCAGSDACDASGRCRHKDGQPCGVPGDCVSGFCVDGVCCATACKGLCQSCRADIKNAQPDGVCGDVADGKDPHDDCADLGACSCGRDGMCNGSGACRLYAKGTDCLDCSSAGDSCDGLGACVSTAQVRCDHDRHTLVFRDGTRQDCAPFHCSSTGACIEACASNDDCVEPSMCHAGGSCAQPSGGPSAPAAPPLIACGVARDTGGGPSGVVVVVIGGAAFVFARRRARRLAPSRESARARGRS